MHEPGTGAVLLTGAGVRRLDARHPDDDARAIVVTDGRVSWIGDPAHAPPVDRRIETGGWVTPAFVDAHVHATATGLAAESLSLAGSTSLAAALDRLRDYAAATDLDPIIGGQWDDFAWPEGRPPRAEELSAAAPGRTILLERVDSHSCVVDADTLARLALGPMTASGHVALHEDGRPTGWLKEAAAEHARGHVNRRLSPQRLRRAREVACRRAAELGVASFHEMGHPGFFGIDDARAWASGLWPVDVVVWWADIAPGAAAAEGLRSGGDLFLDGAIGSQTAAVSDGYRDAPGTGTLFHTDDEVARFFTAASRRGEGAGVHAIGDLAIDQAVRAVERAAEAVGPGAVRACRHRVEHVEMPRPDHPRRMAALGVVASVQPAFDAAWGGPHGLYARRFGAHTALTTNPLAWFRDAGVTMAFGSDSTVTPMHPWAGVVAAEDHRGGHRLDRREAWLAHTVGGRKAAGQDDVGPIAEGLRADLAVWDDDPLSVADPRDLTCLSTWVRGSRVHDLG